MLEEGSDRCLGHTVGCCVAILDDAADSGFTPSVLGVVDGVDQEEIS